MTAKLGQAAISDMGAEAYDLQLHFRIALYQVNPTRRTGYVLCSEAISMRHVQPMNSGCTEGIVLSVQGSCARWIAAAS